MSFSIKFGNFLFKNAYHLYKPLYSAFKKKQDAFEIRLLEQYIGKGDVVLDIGANIGFYARILCDLVGENGKVHCFEPDIKNYAHLSNAMKSYENVVLNNKAVGPRSERIRFYTSLDLNVDHRTYKPDHYDEEIEIEALSMDDYLSEKSAEGIPSKVDFIKMDIQGFEMQAIKGMQETIRVNPRVKIISEFWPYGLKKAGSSVTEYFSYLKELQFDCYLLEKNQLKLLKREDVEKLERLGEVHYFNILALPSHV